MEDGEGGEGKQIMASEMPGSPPARSGGSLSLHQGGEYAGVYLHGGYHRVGEQTYCKDLYRLDLGEFWFGSLGRVFGCVLRRERLGGGGGAGGSAGGALEGAR